LGLEWGLSKGETAETVLYFIGLFEEEIDLEKYLEDGKPDLEDLDEDELMEIAEDIGARRWEDMKVDHLKNAVERRLTKEIDPVIKVRHYVDRNRNQFEHVNGRKVKKPTYANCGDPEAAVTAEDMFNFETKCRICVEKQAGDKGIGGPSQRICWAVFDTRFQHRIKAEKKGDYDEYIDCTSETKGRCIQCSKNRKIDDTPQEDMEKEKLEDLMNNYGYAPRYRVGARILELPMSQLPLVESTLSKIRNTKCRCGEGDLDVTGAQCPECEEEFDFDELVASGWNPEESDPSKQLTVVCGSCEEKVKPEEEYECSECDDPTPARAGDVPIRAAVTKGDKGNTWSFQIDGDVCVMDVGDGELEDRILGTRMPDWEEFVKPMTVKAQLSYLSLHEDPLGEVEVEESSDDVGKVSAPSMGKGKSKSTGKKKPKGKKASGFLRRSS
jgi:hypothetical protein